MFISPYPLELSAAERAELEAMDRSRTLAADIIGLYLNPQKHSVLFCVDEKTAIRALDRWSPVPPLRHPFVWRYADPSRRIRVRGD